MDDVKYDIKREEEEEEHGLLKFVETVRRQCSRKKRRALSLMSMRS